MNVLPETQLSAGPQTALARRHPHCPRKTQTDKFSTSSGCDQRENKKSTQWAVILEDRIGSPTTIRAETVGRVSKEHGQIKRKYVSKLNFDFAGH